MFYRDLWVSLCSDLALEYSSVCRGCVKFLTHVGYDTFSLKLPSSDWLICLELKRHYSIDAYWVFFLMQILPSFEFRTIGLNSICDFGRGCQKISLPFYFILFFKAYFCMAGLQNKAVFWRKSSLKQVMYCGLCHFYL